MVIYPKFNEKDNQIVLFKFSFISHPYFLPFNCYFRLHLCFQILFIPTQREERVGIFLDNTQILTCQEGLATMQELEARDKLYNLTERSCSSLGVFLVNKDQILSIRIETRNTKMRLWSVGNNFGVVLLYRK